MVRIAPAQMTGRQMPLSNHAQMGMVAPDRGGVSLLWGYLGMAVLARPALPIGWSRRESSLVRSLGQVYVADRAEQKGIFPAGDSQHK